MIKKKIKKIVAHLHGPSWARNPKIPKSAAEIISKRNCPITFIFSHNIHIIEVYVLCLCQIINDKNGAIRPKFRF